jgi:hypothetical protein
MMREALKEASPVEPVQEPVQEPEGRVFALEPAQANRQKGKEL